MNKRIMKLNTLPLFYLYLLIELPKAPVMGVVSSVKILLIHCRKCLSNHDVLYKTYFSFHYSLDEMGKTCLTVDARL